MSRLEGGSFAIQRVLQLGQGSRQGSGSAFHCKEGFGLVGCKDHDIGFRLGTAPRK